MFLNCFNIEIFEKISEPKIVVCLICTSKLAKSSIKSHLETKKHLNAVSKKGIDLTNVKNVWKVSGAKAI